jgi:hypothetical protein
MCINQDFLGGKEMKRRLALSIALTLSIVLVSLVSLLAPAQGQQQVRFRADTGIVALGPNQLLRLTISGEAGASIAYSFRRIDYVQTNCSGGVCKLGSVTDLILDPVTLMPGEAASIDIPQSGFAGVRGIVMSNRRNVQATAMIINTVTGETTSHIIIANTEGDFH